MNEIETMLLDALQAIAPHLRLSHEGQTSDCVLRSRAEELRRAADREDQYESAVRKVRAAIAAATLANK